MYHQITTKYDEWLNATTSFARKPIRRIMNSFLHNENTRSFLSISFKKLVLYTTFGQKFQYKTEKRWLNIGTYFNCSHLLQKKILYFHILPHMYLIFFISIKHYAHFVNFATTNTIYIWYIRINSVENVFDKVFFTIYMTNSAIRILFLFCRLSI